MEDVRQASFNSWAIVEVMGHQTYPGYVTTEAYGGAVLFRVEVPELPERDRVLKYGEYAGSLYCTAGSTVRDKAVPGYTKLIGAGSIYAITPCTEEAARKAAETLQARAFNLVALPKTAALPEPQPDEEDPDEDTGDESENVDDLF